MLAGGGALWGSGVDVLNARRAREELKLTRAARAERQIAGLASVGVVGLSPSRPTAGQTCNQQRARPSAALFPAYTSADGMGSLLHVQQIETDRAWPPRNVSGMAVGASGDAGARGSSIRGERMGFSGASLTRHRSRPEHIARLAAQKEEERRTQRPLTTPGKRHHRSSPPRGPPFTQQPRRAATANPDSTAPLTSWQQTLTPWSAPPAGSPQAPPGWLGGWLATGLAERPFRLKQGGSEAQLFRNLDLDTPGSLARTALYRSSSAYGPKHTFAGRSIVHHLGVLDPFRRPVSG